MSYKPPRGLGKGLGALLGDDTDIESLRKPVGYVNKEIVSDSPSRNTADIVRIPISIIEPNPYQPRMSFDEESLRELAESITSLGLIQPITVRKKGADRYQIISGERRYRACTIAGLDMIPAYIIETDDQGMLEMAIVENIQRENLDPIETALSYQRLIDECSLTQEQMAQRVGKSRVSVTNYLRLLKLPAKVQHDLKVGLISVGHAKALLGIDNAHMQEHLCDVTIQKGLSVRQLEDKIRKLNQPVELIQDDAPELPEHYYKVLEYMGKVFGDNISLKRSSSGKGSITLRFNSDEEMQKLLELLEK